MSNGFWFSVCLFPYVFLLLVLLLCFSASCVTPFHVLSFESFGLFEYFIRRKRMALALGRIRKLTNVRRLEKFKPKMEYWTKLRPKFLEPFEGTEQFEIMPGH